MAASVGVLLGDKIWAAMHAYRVHSKGMSTNYLYGHKDALGKTVLTACRPSKMLTNQPWMVSVTIIILSKPTAILLNKTLRLSPILPVLTECLLVPTLNKHRPQCNSMSQSQPDVSWRK